MLLDDVDVEEFVRSAFPEDTPLEKHVLVISPVALLLYLYCRSVEQFRDKFSQVALSQERSRPLLSTPRALSIVL